MEEKNYQIMVIDDEPEILTLMNRWLGFDYNVTCFSDPWQALRAFKKGGFHLLITDVYMQEMDGFELLKGVQTLKAHVNTIVMTAHKNLSHAVRAQQHGADYIFFKPLEMDEFKMAVKTLYNRYLYWIKVLEELSRHENQV